MAKTPNSLDIKWKIWKNENTTQQLQRIYKATDGKNLKGGTGMKNSYQVWEKETYGNGKMRLFVTDSQLV